MHTHTRTHRRATSIFAIVAAAALTLTACGDDDNASGTSKTSTVAGVVEFDVKSASHVRTEVDYEQSPPVGGDHLAVWQNCGVYDAPIFNETAVHSLEHGAAWITYAPELDADGVSALRDVVGDRTYVLLSPYEGLPKPIVANAWGVQLTIDDAGDPRLIDFLDAYAQGPQAPEPGAPCTNGYDQPA